MTWRIALYWLFGLTWALVVGHLATKFVLNRIRAFLVAARTAAGDTSTPPWSIGTGVPSWLTGTIERLFFTVAVAFDLSGVATAMMTWMLIKLAANWNRPTAPPDPVGALALSAALGGLASMFFAMTGGMICRPPR